MELREFKSYQEMLKKHQEDISNFPIVYMFGKKSDAEIKSELGKIGAKCMAECTSVFGCGDVIRKVDVPKLFSLLANNNKERNLFFVKEENLVEGIVYEMNNHEYAYSYDDGDVLDALGKAEEDFQSPIFRNAWEKAKKRYLSAF